MTDQQHDGGVGGWGSAPAGSSEPRPAGSPPAGSAPAGSSEPPQAGQARPGWYPDPWARGQHRYWNGQVWTGDAFPHGPAEPSTGYLAPPSAAAPAHEASMPPYLGSPGATGWAGSPADHSEAPPPPGWSAPTAGFPPNPPTTPILPVPTEERTRPPRRHVIAILLLVPLLVGLSSFAGFYLANRGRTRAAAQESPPSGTSPNSPGTAPGTTLPSGLSGIGLTQSDVGSGVNVQELDNGNQVSAQAPTLDLCNGKFASESLRTARLQVVALDAGGTSLISTETVTYSSPAGAEQAFSELTATAKNCPSGPVTSPIGEQTVTTHFNPPPDDAWPQAAGVQRLAFDFTTTDSSGQSEHSVAVYLRRGRVLLGVYFNQPDQPQTAVAGQTTIPTIVNVFATRMAQLPQSVVNG